MAKEKLSPASTKVRPERFKKTAIDFSKRLYLCSLSGLVASAPLPVLANGGSLPGTGSMPGSGLLSPPAGFAHHAIGADQASVHAGSHAGNHIGTHSIFDGTNHGGHLHGGQPHQGQDTSTQLHNQINLLDSGTAASVTTAAPTLAPSAQTPAPMPHQHNMISPVVHTDLSSLVTPHAAYQAASSPQPHHMSSGTGMPVHVKPHDLMQNLFAIGHHRHDSLNSQGAHDTTGNIAHTVLNGLPHISSVNQPQALLFTGHNFTPFLNAHAPQGMASVDHRSPDANSQSVAHQNGQSVAGLVRLPGQFSLDLSSSTASVADRARSPVQIALGGTINASGVVTGGTVVTLNHGSLVTAAEYAAISQVAHGGQQTLLLDNSGAAAGGYLTLAAGSAHNLSTLNDPNHVTIDLLNFGVSNPFNVTGSAVINGNLVAFNNNGQAAPAVLNFGSLQVGSSGSIVGSLPANAQIISGATVPGALTIHSATNIVSAGTIASDGKLNINAGGSINNLSVIHAAQNVNLSSGLAATPGLPADISNTGTITSTSASVNLLSGMGAVNNSGNILAAQNININTGSGVLSNTGTIAAGNNLNFTAPATQNISVNNSGVIQAGEAINVRDASYQGNANATLNGGNWLSNQLNVDIDQGITNINAHDLTGTVNIEAQCAHVLADTPELKLGNLNISGDPTYFNNGGSINVGSITTAAGQDLTLVASQDVIVTGTLTTSTSAGSGGNLNIIAGANFVPPPAPPTGEVDNDTGTTITLADSGLSTHGSSTGGRINVSGAITTNGGNLTMVAFSGSGGSSGQIGTSTIATGGSGAGNNGSVTVIAGNPSGVGFGSGAIDTTGGGGSPGSINISTAIPSVNAGTTITNGVLSGGFTAGTTTGSSIATGSLTTSNGAVSLTTGASLTAPLITTGGGAINLVAGGDLADSNAVTGASNVRMTAGGFIDVSSISTTTGSVTLLANTNFVDLRGNITAPGGILIIGEREVRPLVAGIALNADSATGSAAGNITVIAGGHWTETAGVVTVDGQQGAGGTIEAGNWSTISAKGTAPGVAGGDVTFVAFNGRVGSSGTATVTTSGGSSADRNGNFVAVGNSGITQLGTIDTTGGLTNTGSIDIRGANPLPSGGSVTIAESNAAVSGSFLQGNLAALPIQTFQLKADAAPITIRTTSGADLGVSLGGAGTLAVNAPTSNLLVSADAGIDLEKISAGSITFLANSTINLRENISAPGGILMVTSSVFSANGGTNVQIITDSASGAAGNITLISGANFSENIAAGTVQITPPTGSPGGFTNAFVSSLSAKGLNPGVAGGNITLGFFGELRIGGTSFVTSGGAGAANGKVTAVASGAAIEINNSTTSSGTAGSGNVVLRGANPLDTGFSSTISESTHAITSGSSLTQGTLTNTSISFGTLTGNGALTTVDTLGGVDAGAVAHPGGVQGLAGAVDPGQLIMNAGGLDLGKLSVNNITLLSASRTNIRQNITAPGGLLMVTGTNFDANGGINVTVSTDSATGAAGNMMLISGAQYSENRALGTVTVTPPASGAPGSFQNANVTTFSAQGTSAGVAGGNITLGFFGDLAIGGSSFFTGGGAGAANGNLTLVASGNSPGLEFQNSTTSNGSAGSGNVVIRGATPLNSGASSTISESTHAITSGSSLTQGSLTNTNVFFGTLTGNGGLTTVDTLGAVDAGASIHPGGVQGLAAAVDPGELIMNAGRLDLGKLSVNNINLFSATSTNIRQNITAPSGLLMVTGTNFDANGGINVTVSTDSPTGAAGNMTLISGSQFSENRTTGVVTIAPPVAGSPGGFTNANVTTFSAQGTNPGVAGGDITLSFFGDLPINNSSFLTGGGSGAANGNVTLVASGSSPGLEFKDATTSNGATGSGNVTLRGANPLNAGQSANISETTHSAAGQFTNGSLTNTNIFFHSLMGNGGTKTVDTLALADLGAGHNPGGGVYGLGGSGTLDSGKLIVNSGVIDAGTLHINSTALMAPGTIQLRSSVTSPAGITMVTGSNINPIAPITISSDAAAAAGGISLLTGVNFSENRGLGTVSITGVSGTGGAINSGNFTLSAQGNAPGASGGNINLAAFGGVVALPNSVSTGGQTTGANGNVTEVSNIGISAGNIDTTGGASGGQSGTGTITLQTINPPTVSFSTSTGNVATGSLTLPASATFVAAPVTAGNLTTAGAAVTIDTGALAQVTGTITASGRQLSGSLNAGAGGAVSIKGGSIQTADIASNGGSGGIGSLSGAGGSGGSGGIIGLLTTSGTMNTGALSALGGTGGDGGSTGGPGPGGAGGAGGSGGTVTLSPVTSVTVNGINASGGTGGAGGGSPGGGGVGGAGGAGGAISANTVVYTAGQTIGSTADLIDNGGNGGPGGFGFAPAAAGAGGAGGTVNLVAFNVTISGAISANGGSGATLGNGSSAVNIFTCSAASPTFFLGTATSGVGGAGNFVTGNVTANGFNGGNIEFMNDGGQSGVVIGGNAQAIGTGGSQGTILLTNCLPPTPTPAVPVVPVTPVVVLPGGIFIPVLPIVGPPLATLNPIIAAPVTSVPTVLTPPNNDLSELIGTKIATDQTPFGLNPIVPGTQAGESIQNLATQDGAFFASPDFGSSPSGEVILNDLPSTVNATNEQLTTNAVQRSLNNNSISQNQAQVQLNQSPIEQLLAAGRPSDTNPDLITTPNNIAFTTATANSVQNQQQLSAPATTKVGALLNPDVKNALSGETTTNTDAAQRQEQVLKGIEAGTGTGVGILNLQHGNIVLAPKKAIVVDTAFAQIHIAAGAAVYIMHDGASVSVFNLHDTSKDGVRIVTNSKVISPLPGTQVILTTKEEDVTKINIANRIGYRNLHKQEIAAGRAKESTTEKEVTIHIAEFSIIGAFTNVPVLRSMLTSKDAEQRKLAHLMLKDAVIWLTLNTKAAPYTEWGTGGTETW